jgi:hypothetical protein
MTMDELYAQLPAALAESLRRKLAPLEPSIVVAGPTIDEARELIAGAVAIVQAEAALHDDETLRLVDKVLSQVESALIGQLFG